ncbi:hypothetical protein PFLUV_G00227780 [Perca fluviatilis]|uniref:DUF4657 domain-containing protein n=1 Tax=Perca fluviatilis TaxID=8168 RepID=A0A6A5EJP1_PERFL|nr:uncharacterized protein si:ch211-250c4.3 [Perca fluviatilis]KAF1376154.1 hypothetical protein PFLUV_G00227780 [Perca fluviatilis]
MSVKRKKAGLVISWQKSFSILAPWRKGKGDRDTVLDSEVVLTKMKLFSNFQERFLMAEDDASTISTVSVTEQDISDPTKASEVNSHLDDKSRQPRMESDSDYLSAIFLHSQLPRLYKFESEDSGVELTSGANSPSTPTGSEQSFMVHSRESSCNTCNLNSDPTTLPDKLVTYAQTSEIKQAEDSVDNSPATAVDTQDNVFVHSEELSSAARVELHIDEDVDRDQCRASGISPERHEEMMSGQLKENSAVSERTCLEDTRPGKQTSTGACDDVTATDFQPEPIRRSATSDSLREYMDECCRLSEAQQRSNPLGSGLGYLEHICQLIEKIGQLQETNLQLQRHICSLQKDDRMTKTKEDFFQQHCSCGAASLAFHDVHKRHFRSECLSPSGTLSDLSTIHEVTRHPLISARRDVSAEGLTPVPLWRKGLNRRSYTEGEARFLGDSTEGLTSPQRMLSENCTWGRVKDLVRKSKLRNQSRLGLTSTSLKMSCPQLYMPDLEPGEPAARNRNSMIVLGHQSKLDFPWLQ